MGDAVSKVVKPERSAEEAVAEVIALRTVSYTHLTLPTILLV